MNDQAIAQKIQERTAMLRAEFRSQLQQIARKQHSAVVLPNQPAQPQMSAADVSHLFLIHKIAALQIIVERQQQQIAQLLAAKAAQDNGVPP